jgi:hypothetical protein
MVLLASLSSISLMIVILITACLGERLHESKTVVDLGYAKYQGYYNRTSGLNVFLG